MWLNGYKNYGLGLEKNDSITELSAEFFESFVRQAAFKYRILNSNPISFQQFCKLRPYFIRFYVITNHIGHFFPPIDKACSPACSVTLSLNLLLAA